MNFALGRVYSAETAEKLKRGDKERATKESLQYNTQYSEDFELKKFLDNSDKGIQIDRLFHLLREKAYRDGYIAGYEQAKKDLSCVQQRLNVLEEHNMTIDDVITCLEKHNEIHSRQEPRAYYITKALNIAIDFLRNHRWHYPSKGEYPPSMEKYCGRSEPVLVWLGDNNVEYAQWIEESKTWGRGICELTGTVIAWRYIELPEEM